MDRLWRVQRAVEMMQDYDWRRPTDMARMPFEERLRYYQWKEEWHNELRRMY